MSRLKTSRSSNLVFSFIFRDNFKKKPFLHVDLIEIIMVIMEIIVKTESPDHGF